MRERVESPYNRIWKTVVGLLAVLGLAAALVLNRVTINLIAFLVAAFVTGAVCLSVGLIRERRAAELIRSAKATMPLNSSRALLRATSDISNARAAAS